MKLTPSSVYQCLFDFFGEQDWWPVDTSYHRQHESDPRFEIIIGTILTQNTAWTNVETALGHLKSQHLLDIKNIAAMDSARLTALIQSSGYFNQKAARLQELSTYLLKTYQGDLSSLFNKKKDLLRQELLSLKGIGPETADSILLYAGNFPVFVVDAYTKRICQRIPFEMPIFSYDSVQQFFQQHLQKGKTNEQLVYLYQQYHALLVEQAKQFCKVKPKCDTCPLQTSCSFKKML